MSPNGAKIFLWMQIGFVILGFVMFFGLKALKDSWAEEPQMTKVLEQENEHGEIECHFSWWLGKKPDERAIKETGRPYRILPPGSMATMDYIHNRINIHTDENGMITMIRCG